MNKLLKRYHSLSKQTKAVFWFAGCNFLQKGISFITVPIFTRLMSTEEYGVYTLYSSWYQILIIFTSLYLFNGVFDNGMAKFDRDRDKFTSAMLGLSLTVTIIVFLVYISTSTLWQSILGLSRVYIILMFAEMVVAPAICFWSARQRFEYQYKRLVFITILKSLINPLLGLAMIVFFQDKALGRVISIVITELIFDVVLLVYQFAKGKVFFNKAYWKYAITLAIPLIPHYLAGMILNQGDRVMIDRLIGKSAVALYGVAYSIGMLVQIFVNAIHSATTPWVYKCMKEKNLHELHQRYRTILVFVALLILGLTIVCPELVQLFGSEKYASAVYVIPPVAASVYCIFLYGILAFPEFYFEKTKFLMLASVGAAGLNIILNYIYIQKYGFVAAGYTTLACYIIYGIGHYLVGKRLLNNYIEGASMVDTKFTLILSFFVVIGSIVGSILIPYTLVRYSIVIFIVLAMFIFKNRIISFFIEIKK